MKRLVIFGALCALASCQAIPLRVQQFTFTPLLCISTTGNAMLAIEAAKGNPFTGNKYTYNLLRRDGTQLQTQTVAGNASFNLTTNDNVYYVEIVDQHSSIFFGLYNDLSSLQSGPLKYDFGEVKATFSGPINCLGVLNLNLTIQIPSKVNNVRIFGPINSTKFPYADASYHIGEGLSTISITPQNSDLANNCGSILNFAIINRNVPLSITAESVQTSTCLNKKAGSINFQIQGGIGSFNYTLSDKEGHIVAVINDTNQTQGSFDGLPNGIYTLEVFDNSEDCGVTTTVTVKNSCNKSLLLCCAGK